MRICLIWACAYFHKLPHRWDRLSFNGSQNPVQYLPLAMGPWVQGVVSTYNYNAAITVNQISIYGPVWDALNPQTAVSLGRVVISWQLGPVVGSWVQGILGTYTYFTPTMENEKYVYGLESPHF